MTTETKEKAKDGLIRIGVYLTEDGYRALQDFSKNVGLAQAVILEAAVKFVPHDVLTAACEKLKEERRTVKSARREARKLLEKMTPEQIAELLKKAG